jgi:formylglycine-generating enzyme required for sulfatase activity
MHRPLPSLLVPWLRTLRRMDFLPTKWAWALGLAFGVLAGAALAGPVPRILGIVGFLGLLGVAWALAWSGEPVAVVESAPRHEPEPVYTSRFVDLVSIPGGTFLMGSAESQEGRYSNEGPVHEVHVSRFACTRYPVTRRIYAEITGLDPGWPEGETDDRPVNNISWLEAVTFCNQLSDREGVTHCYWIDGKEVTWDRTADGYRLLTEAEWEYACRAGTTTRFSFGNNEGRLYKHAWLKTNSKGEPRPVGRKTPNRWGLHDMHGNVYEWCWDWYGGYLETALSDPAGPPAGESRVLRGGAFNFSPKNLRSTGRFRYQPSFRDWFVGFRCARGASPP